MSREKKALAPAAVAKAREELARARGRRRLQLILDAEDPGALVRALPADELYFTIREIGLGDAAPLVPLASLEQFRTFLDLDAWRGDQLDPRRALTWLRAARTGSQQDPDAAVRWRAKLAGVDREILFFVLRSDLVVHDLQEDPDPDIQSDRAVHTPDGKFLVEFLPSGAEYSALRGIVDDLFEEDPFQAARLLSSLAWEAPSELEETALRWRSARLADAGIPSLEEALSWFARPPRAPAGRPGAPERPPGFWLAALASGSLLDRAMAALSPEDRHAVEAQVVAAASAVLVADRVDVSDPEAVRTTFQAARALLELGLEKRLREQQQPLDDDAAAGELGRTPVKRIFQEGFGRVLELRWRAERLLASEGAGTRDAPLLDAPLGEALLALSSRRPRYFPGLEAPREHWATVAAAAFQPRPFLLAAELDRARWALDLAEGLLQVARSLGLAVSLPGTPAPRLTALYLTALANERAGRRFAPEPIAAGDLPAALQALQSVEDERLERAGEAGKLLLELAQARAAELQAMKKAGAWTPEAVTDLVVRGA